MKLNKQQLEAIKHQKGPLLIIAGAGTGKTTVITERIKYLIFSKFAKPSEILALTFTEKAAQEMEERVDIAMPYGYTDMWISTFHSFCDRILKHELLHIGLNPKYKLIGKAETVQLIRDNLFRFNLDYFRPLGNPTKFVSGILQHFSRLQDEDVSPSEYINWVKSKANHACRQTGSQKPKLSEEEKIELKKWKELAGAYRTYEELKIKEGVMDFGDLIVKTLKLFRERPNVLKQYQKQFKYILVDEFQDTNIAQNELVKLLAGKSGNISVVADDDQAIYRWRGAAVSNVIQFKESFPKAKVVVLVKNYRTAQEILDKAYALIQHNNPDRLESVEGINKKLIAQRRKVVGEISFIHANRVEDEAEAVAKKIKDLVERKEYDYRDFAILVRANNHAEPFVRALKRIGVPCQFLGPGRLFRQPEIVDLISYLKVLDNFDDSISLYRLLSIKYFNIKPRDLMALNNYAKKQNLTLFEVCEKIDKLPSTLLTSETRKKIKQIFKIINRHLGKIKKETAGQLLYYFLQDTGLLQKLLNPDDPETEKQARNISKFFDKLKTYEADHEDATVPIVCDWIELLSELGESPLAVDVDWTNVDAVNILTIHSAKGLEFPVVFLVNLVSQRFPTNERREQIPIPEDLIKEVLPVGNYHLQEERRLFYVGMTRSKDKLFLSAADYYGEGRRRKKLSPFIFEALGEGMVGSERRVIKGEQLSFLGYKPEKPALPTVDYILRPHIDYLSYSQIQTFQICPLHYKLKYILQIPTPQTAAQSFGTAIHNSLRDFYAKVHSGRRPTKKLMINILRENWINEGYSSKSHERKAIEKGERLLTEYLKKEFDSKNLPFALEKMFKIPLRRKGDNDWLMIGGKIDRVDILPDGKIEIIDYKTGTNLPSKKDIEQDLQLTIYALAATKIKEKPFQRKPEEVVLSLYYLEEQKKLTTKRTARELKEAIDKIFDWREKIESSDFKCSGHMFCQNCEYSLICRAGR